MTAGPAGAVSLIGGDTYLVSADATADQKEAAAYWELWRLLDPSEVQTDLEAQKAEENAAVGGPILPLYKGDYETNRLAFAKKMGADVVVNSAAGDPAEALEKAIGRPDADVVFEAVGLEATVAMGIRLTANRRSHQTLPSIFLGKWGIMRSPRGSCKGRGDGRAIEAGGRTRRLAGFRGTSAPHGRWRPANRSVTITER